MIIGITGTLGSGKGTVTDYLEKKGFRHYSASGFIAQEIIRRGSTVNRDTLHIVGDDLRAKHSPSYIFEELYKEAIHAEGDAVIEAFHAIGEVTALRQKPKFHLLAVDADQKLRYQRIVERGGEKDNVSFEKFMADEEREMHATGPHEQNIAGCIELADYRLMNNGTVEELRRQIDQVLAQIEKRENAG